MKIKMLTSGPNKNYKPGSTVEVDEQRARVLIDGKHAETIGRKVTGGNKIRTERL